MAKQVTDFPIGSKVLYSATPCNGYDSLHGEAGIVVGYGHSDIYCDVKFGLGDSWLCCPEELTLVAGIDQDGQYRMAL